jgi:hypothetical protein
LSGGRIGKHGTVLSRQDVEAANLAMEQAVKRMIVDALRGIEDRGYTDGETTAVYHALPEAVRSIPPICGLDDGTFEAGCRGWIEQTRPRPYVIEYGGSFVGWLYDLHLDNGTVVPLERDGSPYLDDAIALEAAFDVVERRHGDDAAIRAVFSLEWNGYL